MCRATYIHGIACLNKLKIFTILVFIILFSSYSGNCQTNLNQNKFSIDHVNVAVNDLPEARVVFEKLGFTIKPGRVHGNSIDNLHIKFANGTELELITSRKPLDDLATEYLNLLDRNK